MNDLFNVKNKVALVTGSTRGIGKAAAELFAAQGAHIIVNGRSKKDVERTRNEFLSRNYSVLGLGADVRDSRAVAKMVAYGVKHFGRIDILVNNAGIIVRGRTIERVSDANWNNVLDVNLKGVFNVCRAVVPLMKKRGGGAIVNISSQSAAFGSSGAASAISYPASKGGVISFTRSLAAEVGPSHIRVNAVMPGLTRTDMTAWLNEDKARYRKIINEIPLRCVGTPADIAAACLFLASDMAQFITGEILVVNGGRPSLLFL